MIARAWHGITAEDRADAYHQYLLETGVPELRSTPGNKGVFVLRDIHDGKAEFLLISLWESWEAIRKFAGDPVNRARYYPRDAEFLYELEPEVTHYEVLTSP
jgi:heme-degrading monooxygenase HmoA